MMLKQTYQHEGVVYMLRYTKASPVIETYELTNPVGIVGRCTRTYNAVSGNYSFELKGDLEIAQIARACFN